MYQTIVQFFYNFYNQYLRLYFWQTEVQTRQLIRVVMCKYNTLINIKAEACG